MKYRLFHSEGDTQVYLQTAIGQPRFIRKNTFIFTGFSNKEHPYRVAQWNWVKTVLETNNIPCYIETVPTQDQIGGGIDKGYFDIQDIRIPLTMTEGFYVIKDEEMGRGWAVLVSLSPGANKIITQEHRDTVIEELLRGDLFRELNIDYRVEIVPDIEATYKEITSGKYKI